MSKPDLNVNIGKMKLKNPVMPASGCFGYGEEYASYFDLSRLGAIVVKGTTREPWPGNLPPRLAETSAGLLNAIGLQNPGAVEALAKIRTLAHYGVPVILNVAGHSADDYCEVIKFFAEEKAVEAFELNVSCPNLTAGGMAFGTDPEIVYRLTSRAKQLTDKTLIVKLSPNVTDIAAVALAAERGGADAVSLINTLLGMAIDISKKEPVLANVTGGLSGPAVKPVALRMVWQVSAAVDIPVIGMGGICCAADALEFILAGASAVAIGTALFTNPLTCLQAIDGITAYLEENVVATVKEIVGLARKNQAQKREENQCGKS
ncbi:MAG TPA: dihydroorotate dehydrogenase [Candidatus Limnocylindrales bacterium]|nr:dihydroorotate dehydrogenase [Candidatus Limnocylindrales bacterium]